MAMITSATAADKTPQEDPRPKISLPADEKTMALKPQCLSRSKIFPKIWSRSTEDRNITLYGFRRFKTSHLINLRFLEEEIAELDHNIYQAGLSLDSDARNRKSDRLGLRYSRRDSSVPPLQDIITESMVIELRRLLKEYG